MQEAKVVGAAPVVRAVCEDIGLVDVINRNVTWDDARCKLSPGRRIMALIVNILTSREPLYRVWESFEDTDCELLLGAGVMPADLNDDALARALDKLQAADARLVFSLVAARALAHEGVDCRFLHWDSTSRSLYGEYPTATGRGAVRPTYGHSKDHRPDLKQIVLTLLCNREGLPLVGEVRDGNSSDQKLNREMVAELCQSFSPQELGELVYVADSALVSGPNLEALHRANLRFLSRLPNTFAVAAEVKAAAWTGDWQPVGRLSSRKDAACYQASEQSGVIAERQYRLVVFRSDHLDERKAKTLQRELEEEQRALSGEARQLAGRDFACSPDAELAAALWLRSHASSRYALAAPVVEVKERQKQDHRGRPRRDEPVRWLTCYRIAATVGERHPDRVRAELERRSAFVLITNLAPDEFPADRLLLEYKAQTSIEQRFHFLKDESFVDAFFLKKPERVEALGYVLLMACLVFSLLERRVRQTGKPLPSPSRGRLANPTGYELLRHLHSALVIPVDRQRRVLQVSPSFREAFHMILEAAGFDERLYTQVPARERG